MRITALALTAILGLTALPASLQASPAAPQKPVVTASSATLVRGGCGLGWHRQRWRDRWGRWHVRCVPNRY